MVKVQKRIFKKFKNCIGKTLKINYFFYFDKYYHVTHITLLYPFFEGFSNIQMLALYSLIKTFYKPLPAV